MARKCRRAQQTHGHSRPTRCEILHTAFVSNREAYPNKTAETGARRGAADAGPIWHDGAVADLDVEIQARPGHAILVLHGELDLATKSQLHDVAMAQLSVSGLATLG